MTDEDTAPTTEDQADAAAAVPRASAFRLVLLCVLVLSVLVSAGVVIWLLAERRGAAEEMQRERDLVRAQAEQFMLRSYNYGPDDLDEAGRLTEYRELVGEVVTDRLTAELEQSSAQIEQLVASQGVGQSAVVQGSGVQTLDADSATAIVGGETRFTRTPEGEEEELVNEQTFRVVVELVKVEGEWLVDESTVATEAAP